jgi:hypothetical protein
MVDFDENSGDDLHSDYEHEEPNLTNMDDATAQLIDRVQKIEEWVDENPEHEKVRQWSRDILVAALYIENEYAYKSDVLTLVEQKNIELLSERQSYAESRTDLSPKSSRKHEQQIKEIINKIANTEGEAVSVERLTEEAEQEGIGEEEFNHALEKLRRKGEVYEQSKNRFLTT